MEQFETIIQSISEIIWSWPMIILLLGTHLYLTFRLRFPQRKIFTAIKLSLQSDKKSKGDVSQFAALATALAATIGNISRGTGCCILVLVDRSVWNCNKILRGTTCHKISRHQFKRRDVGWPHVCP
mgnify:CR=1 FL=1